MGHDWVRSESLPEEVQAGLEAWTCARCGFEDSVVAGKGPESKAAALDKWAGGPARMSCDEVVVDAVLWS